MKMQVQRTFSKGTESACTEGRTVSNELLPSVPESAVPCYYLPVGLFLASVPSGHCQDFLPRADNCVPAGLVTWLVQILVNAIFLF